MELKFIKEKKCPVCGCGTILQESIGCERDGKGFKYCEHENGGRWEQRIFACGQRLLYSPSDKKLEIDKDYNFCKNNEAYFQKFKKQEKAYRELQKFIDSLDVDNQYKASLKSSL